MERQKLLNQLVTFKILLQQSIKFENFVPVVIIKVKEISTFECFQ